MMFFAKRYIFISSLLLVIAIFSCRKPDTAPIVEEMIVCCPGSHELYTSSDYDYIWSPVFNPNWFVGPFTFFPNEIVNQEPIFNPNNVNEIAFIKKNVQSSIGEVWKFDFCTGVSSLIVDDYWGGLDWGNNGWLIYTASDLKIHKVKSNGDSNIILSTSDGINETGNWNPSGTMYWTNRNLTYFEDSDGQQIHQNSTYPFSPFGWLNDSTVLGWRDNHIYSMHIPSEELTLINNKWISSSPSKTVNLDEMVCYTLDGQVLSRYSINGDNQLDTIREFIHSYSYNSLDYLDNKLAASFSRVHWKDSLENEIYYRVNVLLLDSDGTNERMMELME